MLFASLSLFASLVAWSQFSYTTIGSTYTQDFNNLGTATSGALTGGSLANVNASLTGWFFSESLANANTIITAGTGSGTAGDTYNFGASGNGDRTLGGLQSGNTAHDLWVLSDQQYGKHDLIGADRLYRRRPGAWARRAGAIASISSYSTNATSLITGTWTDVDALDYANPGQAAGSGSVQHSASISSTIHGERRQRVDHLHSLERLQCFRCG
jgi:hypothetical protein